MNHTKRKSDRRGFFQCLNEDIELDFSLIFFGNQLNRKYNTNPNLLASMALGMIAGAAGGMITVKVKVLNSTKRCHAINEWFFFRFFHD